MKDFELDPWYRAEQYGFVPIPVGMVVGVDPVDGSYKTGQPCTTQTHKFTCGYGALANLMGWESAQQAYEYMREYLLTHYGRRSVGCMPTLKDALKRDHNSLNWSKSQDFLKLFYKITPRDNYSTLISDDGVYILRVHHKWGKNWHMVLQRAGWVYDSNHTTSFTLQEYREFMQKGGMRLERIWELTPLTNAEKNTYRRSIWRA